MAIEITIPRLGWSMDEGIFVQWLKDDGDMITAGDMLFVIEGDKATQEIESFDAGVLCIPDGVAVEGDVVQVGQIMGFLLAAGETAPAYQPNTFVASDPPAAATVAATVAAAAGVLQPDGATTATAGAHGGGKKKKKGKPKGPLSVGAVVEARGSWGGAW